MNNLNVFNIFFLGKAKMKNYLLFLLLLFVTINSFSQDSGWSEPVRISNHGYDVKPDYTVDNDGTIHCVWAQKYGSNFSKIYYSKSDDEGETWNEPEDISKNEDLWLGTPKICSDTKNNLYVIYDYDIGSLYNAVVHFRKFDGMNWSEPVDITEGNYSSNNINMAINNNDRLYVFWQHNWDIILYHHLEDTVWSNIDTIYNDGYEYYIRKIIVDNENNLHCVANTKEASGGEFSYKATYFNYDHENNNWSEKVFLSTNTARDWIDIDLDSQNHSHVVWAQHRADGLPPPLGSYYSYFDGNDWSIPTPLGKQDAQREYPRILFDSNYDLNTVIWREYGQGNARYYYLIEYDYLNEMETAIVDSAYNQTGISNLFRNKDYLFMLSVKTDRDDYTFFVEIRKKKLTSTGIKNKNNSFFQCKIEQNYPNPFNSNTKLQYKIVNEMYVNISVYDIKGAKIKTLVNEFKQAGNYYANWDATNNKGQQVCSGVYLYKIAAGKYTAVKKMVLLQ